MKKIILSLVMVASVYASQAEYKPDNNKYSANYNRCTSCHNLSDTTDNGIAPSMRTIINAVKLKHDKVIDQKNFLYNFLVDPENCSLESKVLCEEHSTKKYGKMKNIDLTPKESLLLVNFLIDEF